MDFWKRKRTYTASFEAMSVYTALSNDETSERIAKEIGVISKGDTAVHDTTSQSDGRPTAIAVGAGAVIFMGAVFALLLILDLTTLGSHLKLMRRNLSGLFSNGSKADKAPISPETETNPSLTDLQNEAEENGGSEEATEVDNESSNVSESVNVSEFVNISVDV